MATAAYVQSISVLSQRMSDDDLQQVARFMRFLLFRGRGTIAAQDVTMADISQTSRELARQYLDAIYNIERGNIVDEGLRSYLHDELIDALRLDGVQINHRDEAYDIAQKINKWLRD